MQLPKQLHLIGFVITIVALLAASDASAQIAPIPLQRTCTAGTQANVVAGQNANATAQFPRLVNCPGECPFAVIIGTSTPLSGQFFAWEFTWTQIGKSAPSQFGLQVASDVQIEGASPAVASVSPPGLDDSSLKLGLNDWDSRWLRFNNINASSSLTATYYTKTNLQARPEGAASRSGTTTSTCQLAGAGTVVTEAFQALNNIVRSQAGVCIVDRTLDARGRTVSMTLVSPVPDTLGQCPIALVDILASDNTTLDAFISPDAQITFGTNTRYCFSSSVGGMTCVGTSP